MEKVLPTTAAIFQPSSVARSTDFMIRRAAVAQCPLLLTGETGTGKGYVAAWVHRHSDRRSGPFVPVNCGAIPESLVDSQLFGHALGAFSDAAKEHKGMVRAASGGTLLLDEVSELPLSAQSRLLRLLEEREVQPVGYSMPVLVDVRIIAATNVDLQAAVRQGRFREDLYFRLNVVHLHLKPLRERIDEMQRLISIFNAEFAEAGRQPQLCFNPEAMELLQTYPWPGNIRELRTVIERLHILRGPGTNPVTAADVRHYGQISFDHVVSGPQSSRMPTFRRETVGSALSACRGNVSRAAQRLGVHRSTIYRWMSHQQIPA